MNIETQILRRVVEALRADPEVTAIYVDDGDEDEYVLTIAPETPWDKIEYHCFGVDDVRLIVERNCRLSFVYFIWGNGNDGWDCICDYGVSLEDTLRPIIDWIIEQENV